MINVFKVNTSFDYIRGSLLRIFSNDGGTRFIKYNQLFSDRLPYLWGEGYVIVRNGFWFRPHSDLLRFLYGYGIITLVTFILYFRKVFNLKNIFVFIPAIVAFQSNSLIDDPKLLSIFLIIFGFTVIKKNKYGKEN